MVMSGIHQGSRFKSHKLGLKIGNTLFVSQKYGNDASAKRELLFLPFKTLTAAKNAAVAGDLIKVIDGIFDEADILKALVNYDFELGANIEYSGSEIILDVLNPMTCIIKSNGHFHATGTGKVLRLSSVIADITILGDVEMKAFNNESVRSGTGKLTIKGGRITGNINTIGLGALTLNGTPECRLTNVTVENINSGANATAIRADQLQSDALFLDNVKLLVSNSAAKSIKTFGSPTEAIVYGGVANAEVDISIVQLVNTLTVDSNVK